MKKGGYKIIDLKNINLNGGPAVPLDNIYDNIKNNHRKPILLSGIVIDSVEKPDIFVTVNKEVNGDYVILVYNYRLTIHNNNKVDSEALDNGSKTNI